MSRGSRQPWGSSEVMYDTKPDTSAAQKTQAVGSDTAVYQAAAICRDHYTAYGTSYVYPACTA